MLERINDYKINFHDVSETFYADNLSPFDAGDEGLNLRTNSIKEARDDGNQEGIILKKEGSNESDALQGIGGPTTRGRSMKVMEALNQEVVSLNK